MSRRYYDRDSGGYDERDDERRNRRTDDDYERGRSGREDYGRSIGETLRRTFGGEDYDRDYDRDDTYGDRMTDYGPVSEVERDLGGRPGGRDYGERERTERRGRYGSASSRGRDYDYESEDRTTGARDAGRSYDYPGGYTDEGDDYDRRAVSRVRRTASDYGRDYERGYNRENYSAARNEGRYTRDYDRASNTPGDYERRERGRISSSSGGGGAGREPDDRGWWERARDEVASWFGDEEAERRRRQDEQNSGQSAGASYERGGQGPRGSFRGRGPRGYRRSDERIRDDINDRLTEHDEIDASDIEVGVQNGEVTLTGMVDSRRTKRLAEVIAESVTGVTNVENRLRVQRGESRYETTDTGVMGASTPTTDAPPLGTATPITTGTELDAAGEEADDDPTGRSRGQTA